MRSRKKADPRLQYFFLKKKFELFFFEKKPRILKFDFWNKGIDEFKDGKSIKGINFSSLHVKKKIFKFNYFFCREAFPGLKRRNF